MLEYLYPLLSAATFATSSVIIKHLAQYAPAYQLNLIRTVIGAVIFIIHFFIISTFTDLLALGWVIIAILTLSVTFNVVIGDTSYFKSQELIGVKTAMPIVNTYPIFTIILAFIFLDESVTVLYIVGTVIIIIGIVLLSNTSEDDKHIHTKLGLFLSFVATISYAAGVYFTTVGSLNLDAVTVNMVRLPAGSLILGLLFITQSKEDGIYKPKDKRFVILMLIAGIFGTYFSSLFLVLSTLALGAGLTAVLTSVGPLFALPLAILWLKENVTLHIVMGTILTIIGLVIVLL